MEDINSIILPDFNKKPEEEKKKPLKKVPNARERLTRTNREVCCAYCGNSRILNPDQYQTLFDTYKSEEGVNANFMCKPCDMDSQENPIKFWTIHGNFWNPVMKEIKEMFEAFNSSNKTQQDFITLQRIIATPLKKVHIEGNYTILLSRDNFARGIQFKNFPFIGTLNIKVYEQKEKRIEIVA